MTTQNLLHTVENFLEQTGMYPTTFGKLALKDPTFVFRLRSGLDYRHSTGQRVQAFMEAYSKDTTHVKD